MSYYLYSKPVTWHLKLWCLQSVLPQKRGLSPGLHWKKPKESKEGHWLYNGHSHTYFMINESENYFIFADRPWFPFHSKSFIQTSFTDSFEVKILRNTSLCRLPVLTCSDISSCFWESKGFWNCLNWEESQHLEQILEMAVW